MNNKIENIFKEKFNSYESTPRADLFETIQIKRAKNKRSQWYWALAGLMSVIIISSFAYLSKVENRLTIQKQHQHAEYLLTQPTKNRENAEDKKSNTTTHAFNDEEEMVNIKTRINISQRDKKQLISNATSKIKQANPLPVSPIVNQKLADKFAELYLKNKNVDPSKIRIFTTIGELDVDRKITSTPNVVNQRNEISNKHNTDLIKDNEELNHENIFDIQKTDFTSQKKKASKKVVKKISKLKHSRNRKSQKYRFQNNSYPKY